MSQRRVSRDELMSILRRRYLMAWKIPFAIVAVGLFSMVSISVFNDELRMQYFKELCSWLEPGVELEAARGLASEKGLVFEQDPYESVNADVPTYVLRPDRDWPLRYGCRMQVKQAVIQKISRRY